MRHGFHGAGADSAFHLNDFYACTTWHHLAGMSPAFPIPDERLGNVSTVCVTPAAEDAEKVCPGQAKKNRLLMEIAMSGQWNG